MIKDQILNLEPKLDFYQKEGFYWMIETLEKYDGCLLADDMGIGKTAQVIRVLQYYKKIGIINDQNRVLIISSKSVINHWVKELRKFGADFDITESLRKYKSQKKGEIILTTYNNSRINKSFLIDEYFTFLVIDEAHILKNPNSLINRAISKIRSKKKILITATPIENKISNIFYLLKYIDPKIFKNLQRETYNFSKLVLRRNKNILNLPPLTNINLFYKMNKKSFKNYIITSCERITVYNSNTHEFYRVRNYAKLTTICNSNKVIALLEIYDKHIIKGDTSNKMIVYTQRLNSISDLCEALYQKYNAKLLVLQGDLSTDKRKIIIETFQTSPLARILIISLKTASVGLNLTAANIVVHYDHWWTPSSMAQATARVHRRGQTIPVIVYHLIMINTFEVSLMEDLENNQIAINKIYDKFTRAVT